MIKQPYTKVTLQTIFRNKNSGIRKKPENSEYPPSLPKVSTISTEERLTIEIINRRMGPCPQSATLAPFHHRFRPPPQAKHTMPKNRKARPQ
jgi:hypothetical protein